MPPRRKTTPTGRKITRPLGRPPETTTEIANKINRPKDYQGTEWHEEFLDALRVTPNVSMACKKARIARRTAYLHREKDPEFAKDWDDAVEEGRDSIEAVMVESARLGNVKASEFLMTKWRYGLQAAAAKEEAKKPTVLTWSE